MFRRVASGRALTRSLFSTYGDYYFTAWGLLLTLLGTALAAMKTVVTNVIQTGGGGRLKLVSRGFPLLHPVQYVNSLTGV